VATALSVTFGAGSFDRPGMTRNVEAYDEYLQAQQLQRNFDILDAIVHAEKAVMLDANFALGWRGLGDAYDQAIGFLPVDQTVGYDARRAEAYSRAVALAPEMSELDMDRVDELMSARDYLAAEQMLEQYSAQYDLDARFNAQYGAFMFVVGRFNESIGFSDKAIRLAPQSIDVAGAGGRAIINAGGDFADARARIARAIALGGSVPAVNSVLALLEMDQGNWEAALAATQDMVVTRDVQSRMLQYVIDGKRDEALAELRTLLADDTIAPALRNRHLPVFAAQFGDPELALAFLQSSSGGMNDIGLKIFSEVRRHPGFKAVVEQKGLLNYWRTSGHWSDYCRPVNDDFECF
jgi:tetratricopeptide (TPR) repeat protein